MDPTVGRVATQEHPAGRTAPERQRRTDRDDRAEPVGGFQRGDTDPLLAVGHVELHRFVGVVTQGREGVGRGVREGELLSGGPTEGYQVEAEGEAPVVGPPEESVLLERHRQPVGRGAAETGRLRELRQCELVVGDGVQHEERLVEDADAAYSWFHHVRIISHYMRQRSTIPCTPGGSVSESPSTLAEKVWDRHVVRSADGEPDLLYIDMHLVHEVTSPQAFDGLRMNDRGVRRPELTVATEDHNVPTADIDQPIADPVSRAQIEHLRSNTAEFKVVNHPMGSPGQGIVHVVGPEQGLTLPGMTIVCGDSHTATHGAFGALAFGIGTSEVEHVLATQTLPQARPKTLSVTVDGELRPGVTPKDVILAILGVLGTDGGIGHVAEYRGKVFRDMSMEGRMTVCNMSIEAGAKAGLIAPDETTIEYLRGREHAPSGDVWDQAVADWQTLVTDEGATFDKEIVLDGAAIEPHVSWGTNPGQVIPLSGEVPSPDDFDDPVRRNAAERALEYMGLAPGTPFKSVPVDTIFIGSCTNSRIEDLRAAADVARGRTVADGLRTFVVPGSRAVKDQAEAEGLHTVFIDAGFDWREPGCSMCLAMNPDKLSPGERSASTSNRNFEGRQGRGGRTHLVSPAVAAATAIAGHFATPEDL